MAELCITPYLGGKFRLADWILGHLPPHQRYVEPFGGGASVLLNKPRSQEEVVIEKDYHQWNLLYQIQNAPDDVVDAICSLHWEDFFEEWQRHQEGSGRHDDVTLAALYFVQRHLGKGCLQRSNMLWSVTEQLQTLRNKISRIPRFAERLKGVLLLNGNALDLLPAFDSPKTLVYADPPYVHEVRRKTKIYHHELTHQDHERLLDIATEYRGRFILSGYCNGLYRERLAGWRVERKSTKITGLYASGGASYDATECLWMNW